jgi:hypothetical protein
MDKVSMIFITVKHNFHYIENKIRLHVSTLWGSSSSLYNVMKLLVHKNNTGLFISPSGISELDCATTKTDTAESSISIDKESLQVYFCTRRRGALAGFTARGAVVTKHGVDRE